MVARFALKPHPFWARARGTRRGLHSNHTHCVRKLKMAGGYYAAIAVLTSELAAAIDVDGTDRARGP